MFAWLFGARNFNKPPENAMALKAQYTEDWLSTRRAQEEQYSVRSLGTTSPEIIEELPMNPSGKMPWSIVALDDHLLAMVADQMVFIWSIEDKIYHKLDEYTDSQILLPLSKHCLAIGRKKYVSILDQNFNKIGQDIYTKGDARSMAELPKNYLAVGMDFSVDVWNIETRALLTTIRDSWGPILSLPNGGLAVRPPSISDTVHLIDIDLRSGNHTRTRRGFPIEDRTGCPVLKKPYALLSDGRLAVLLKYDVCVFQNIDSTSGADFEIAKIEDYFSLHRNPTSVITALPGNLLAQADEAGEIYIWHPDSYQQTKIYQKIRQDEHVFNLLFLPNGSFLISGNKSTKIYDIGISPRTTLNRTIYSFQPRPSAPPIEEDGAEDDNASETAIVTEAYYASSIEEFERERLKARLKQQYEEIRSLETCLGKISYQQTRQTAEHLIATIVPDASLATIDSAVVLQRLIDDNTAKIARLKQTINDSRPSQNIYTIHGSARATPSERTFPLTLQLG